MKIRLVFVGLILMGMLHAAIPVRASYAFNETRTFFAFDTTITVNIRHHAPLDATPIFAEVANILNAVHAHATSHEAIEDIKNIYFLNNRPEEFHHVDEMLIEMIETGLAYYNHPLGGQKFNIALGAVLEIWTAHYDDCRSHGICEVPSQAALDAAAVMADPNLIVIDDVNGRIKLPDGLILDLGAIAKGYGAKQVGHFLKSEAVDAFMVNAGESNIEFYGIPESDRDYWIGALRNPFASQLGQDPLYAQITVPPGMNIVTSGDYARFFTVDGVVYHHLIDPATFRPSRHIRAATVVSDDPMLGDVYSTIAFLLPMDEAIAFIDGLDGVEAIWVDKDGNVFYSEHFETLHLLNVKAPADAMGNTLLSQLDPIVASLLAMLGVIVLAFVVTLLRERWKRNKTTQTDGPESETSENDV